MKTLKQTLYKLPLVPKILSPKTRARSESVAAIFRDEGNKFLAEKKFLEALVCYNKSLCHAELNSEDICKGYSSRSEVYFELRNFRKCFENIQLARSHGHGSDSVLDERESRSRLAFLEKPNRDLERVFQLSKSAHERLPFIAKCLEICENEEFGRYIVTNQNLRAGEVIAVEEPLFKCVNLSAMDFYKYQRCFNCLSYNQLSLIPSFHSVMACSQACHEAIGKRNIESEKAIVDQLGWEIAKMSQLNDESLKICGSVEKLKILFESSPKTVFDLDLSNCNDDSSKQNLLKCAASLNPGLNSNINDQNVELFKLSLGNESHGHVLGKFTEHLLGVFARNQYSMHFYDVLKDEYSTLGNCLLPFGSLINHSCDPNVIWVLVDNKIVFFAAKPMRPGQQLFHCYRRTFMHESFEDRQGQLMKQFGFKCTCEACTGNYPMRSNLAGQQNWEHQKSQVSIEEKLTRNWKKLEANYGKFNSATAQTVQENKKLLEILASRCILCPP